MTDAYGVDISVHIRGQDAATGVYPVEATLDDGSRYRTELRNDRERLLSSELEAKEYGLALFEALFTAPIRRAVR